MQQLLAPWANLVHSDSEHRRPPTQRAKKKKIAQVIMMFVTNKFREKIMLEYFTAVSLAAVRGAYGALIALWLHAPMAACAISKKGTEKAII